MIVIDEKALRKKFLCARFTPRDDALDAVTDIIVLSKNKRPPKGYTSAGEIDGVLVCFKVATIPETYARLNHSKSNPGLYPNIPKPTTPFMDTTPYRHSTSDLEGVGAQAETNNFTIRMPRGVKGIDGVPFKLSPNLQNAARQKQTDNLPPLIDPETKMNLNYNFSTERQCIAS